MTWTRFPHYLTFVRGIQRSPMKSPVESISKEPIKQSFDSFFFISMNKLLNKRSIPDDLRRLNAYVMSL